MQNSSMDGFKERFNSAVEVLKGIILELDEKDLPTDLILLVAISVQHLLKLTVDVITRHQYLLDSIQLVSSFKSVDSSAVFSLDEFVSRLISEPRRNELAALPGLLGNCSSETGVPTVENDQRSKYCDNVVSEARVTGINGIKTEIESLGDGGNSDFILQTELRSSQEALQMQYSINTVNAKGKDAKEISAHVGKRNCLKVRPSLKHKLGKTHSKSLNKSVLKRSSLTTLCMVVDEEMPKSARSKSRRKRKTSMGSRHLNFSFFGCFLCNSELTYKSFHLLTQHILSVHISQKTGGLKMLQCPKAGEGCCWTKLTKSVISQTFLAQVLSHLVSEHKIPLPSYISPYRCAYVDCSFESICKYERDSHQADQHTEAEVKNEDGSALVQCDTALVVLTEANCNDSSHDGIIKSLVSDRSQAIDMTEIDEETELEEGNESQAMENKSNIIRFLRFQCFLCLISNTVFDSSSALFGHVRDTHLSKDGEVNVLTCPYCGDKKTVEKGIRSSQLSRLLSHIVKKHKCGIPDYIDPFHCPEPNCSFFSIRRYELTTHAQKHRKPEDKVPCEKCGKFMQQRSLATHTKFCSATTGSRPLFSCDLCDKVMSTKQGLQKHVQTKHENRRDFLCSECTRTFGGRGELEDHAFRKHGVNISNKPVYACEQCKFVTIIPFSLKRHISEVHSDTRQHQCTVCNKFFKSKLQLKSHRVAHEEKTHCCSMCVYTAARKSNLDAHVKAQHSGVQYKCEDCGYHTGYYANLCKHQRMTCSRSRNYQHDNSVNTSGFGGSFNAFLTHGSDIS